MTAKEYLEQAYRIDQRIKFAYDELNRLQELSTDISSPILDEKVQTTKKTEAPFVKYVEKIMEKEEEIKTEIDKLIKLKDEIIKAIDSLDKFEERAVLKYRHLFNYSWLEIAKKLNIGQTTAVRIYNKALRNLSSIV